MNILTALILSLTMSLGAGVKCSDAEMYFCDGFFGASLIETKIETVVYNSKDESEDREIPYGLPCYYYPGSYENTCANVAGAIVLGYFDKDYNELIAGFTSARVIRDRVVYYPQNRQFKRQPRISKCAWARIRRRKAALRCRDLRTA